MNKDFDPSKIQLVSINQVEPNNYNPKAKNTEEYTQVKKSLELNGLMQPIFVREVNGNLVIVDGEQRYTAAKELGYTEIYVYNLGEIPEDEAKALTIWFEVQVPFDKIQLAPLVVELDDKSIQLPYNENLILKYRKSLELEVPDYEDNERESQPDDGLVDFIVRMTDTQYEMVMDAIEKTQAIYGVSQGSALAYLCSDSEVNDEQI